MPAEGPDRIPAEGAARMPPEEPPPLKGPDRRVFTGLEIEETDRTPGRPAESGPARGMYNPVAMIGL